MPLLAISRKDADKITILEIDEPEREIATIALKCRGPFGLAFDDAREWIYAACWRGASIARVELKSLHEAKALASPHLPAWARTRQGTGEIWISSESAGVVTIYSTLTLKAVAEIVTGGGPSDIVFTDGGARAWVVNEKDGNVSLIDARSRAKIRDIPVGKVPQGIAVANGEQELLVANFASNTISVIDTALEKEIAQTPVGKGPIDVLALSGNDSEHAWVTCFGDGTVSVVDVKRRQQVQSLWIGGKPQGLAAHPNGQRVYASSGGTDEVVVLESKVPGSILRRIKMSGGPSRMAVAP